MPTYRFRCVEHTDQEAEDFWPIADGVITTSPLCPVCQEPMRRKFTAPAVHFKGGGWGGSSS